MRRILLAALLALAAAAPALAAQPKFEIDEIERELMCPTCDTRLDMSHAPVADRIRAFVAEKRSAGWTKQQVKDALVADFGDGVLASPPRHGIGWLAWVAPFVVLLGGLAGALSVLRLWRRRAPPAPAAAAPAAAIDPDLDRRVDEALASHDG